MGLLALGTPLEWAEAEKYADHVREHGITQFLHIWDKLKGRVGDGLLWGDEVNPLLLLSSELSSRKLAMP
jgi:glutamate--cysteine ligase catalytic subunit